MGLRVVPDKKIIEGVTFCSTEYVARSLGVERSTVVAYCRSKKIPAILDARRYWVREDHLRDYVRNKYQIDDIE